MAEKVITLSELKKYDTKKGTAVVETTSIPSNPENRVYVIGDKVYAKNIAVATLDANGHLPIEQMPTEALIYKGQWDASTGAYPVQTTYTVGDFYIVSKAGTVGEVSFLAGDWIIWNGTSWDKSANTNAVTKVNGMTGDVCITTVDTAKALTSDSTYVVPVANGGTGLSTVGSAGTYLKVNSAGTALEYDTPTITTLSYGDNAITATSEGLLVTGKIYAPEDKTLCFASGVGGDDITFETAVTMCCGLLVNNNLSVIGTITANDLVCAQNGIEGDLTGAVNGITFSIV